MQMFYRPEVMGAKSPAVSTGSLPCNKEITLKAILGLLTLALGLFSFGANSAPQVNPSPVPGLDVCIFHLSEGETDTYATTDCDVYYTDGGSSVFATFYGPIPGMVPGTYKPLSKWTIDGTPDCIVISGGVAYTSNNYWNIVQVQKYGLQWTQLTLHCTGLTEFQPE